MTQLHFGTVEMKPTKKAKKEPRTDGFDSDEELYISWYLEELKQAGFVAEYTYQPETFNLSPKQSYTVTKEGKRTLTEKEYTLLQPHEYTPDFSIRWEFEALGKFYKNIHINIPGVDKKKYMFWLAGEKSVIDVKPMFDMQNMTRLFTINQKWVYSKYGVYVQKIIPEDLFEKTFTPHRFLFTNKSKAPRKLKYTPRTLKEYLSL